MTPVLSLRLLGGFEVRDVSGRPVVLRQRKAIALLAYLAVRDGRPQARGVLADLLWHDRDDRRARVNLRQTLSIIRRALPRNGHGILETAGDEVALDMTRVACDVVELRRLIATGDAQQGADRVAALYRGPLLGDVGIEEETFGRWLADQRTDLDQAVTDVLRSVLVAEASSDDLGRARRTANLLLKIDRAQEDVHRELMRLHAVQGQRDRALRQYEACRVALRDDLDMEVSADTKRLRASILREAAAPDALGPGVVPDIAVANFRSADRGRSTLRLREEIVHGLSRWRTFVVRDSTLAAARYRLVGSTWQTAGRLRASVRLVEVAIDRTVWSRRFEVEADDDGIPRIAARIAAAVASELEIRAATSTVEPDRADDVWRLSQLGFRAELVRSRAGAFRARAFFGEALKRDPEFAPALTGLVCANLFGVSQGHFGDRRGLVHEALEAAERAATLTPQDAKASIVRSCARLHARDHDGAVAASLRAVELNPANPFAHAHHGVALQCSGDPEGAVNYLKTAVELAPASDPRTAPMRTWYARALTGVGCFDAAADLAEDQLRRCPDHGESYVALASSALYLGDRARARDIAARCEQRLPGFVVHRLGYRECRNDKDEAHLTAGLLAG